MTVKIVVFVSYRRDDAAAEAGLILSALREQMPAEVVFKDTSSIVGGDDWPTEIEAALNAAHIVVVVIGPDCAVAAEPAG